MSNVQCEALSEEIENGGCLTLAQSPVTTLQADDSEEIARLLDELTSLRDELLSSLGS